MSIEEQLEIVESNIAEYGVCDITIEEYRYLNHKIRAEVIEKIKLLAQHYLIDDMDLENAIKYVNKNAKLQDISYRTLTRYEIAYCVDDFIDSVERLKENRINE